MKKSTAPKAASDKKVQVKPDRSSKNRPVAPGFPIVAVGASAGGLEAFEEFFKAMPSDSGLGFVLIAHLDPTHVSLLPELLQKCTKMEVAQATEGVQVQHNHIYVIPPNKEMTILHGALHLTTLPQPRGVNLPIDTFFRSLARDQGSHAICIILSGTGTDGTVGLKAIKGEMGMAMVQEEVSAKYNGMPNSAISTGLADYVLPPNKMPTPLVIYSRRIPVNGSSIVLEQEKMPAALAQIYLLLRARTDHDFSLYKKNTICRRIERRMAVHQFADIDEYARFLKGSVVEIDILFKELLIGVTNFFRDSAAFETFSKIHLLEMLRAKPDGYTVRVWVPGCSSGEEAYSLAIVLQECMLTLQRTFNVQIFGTDIDDEAIAVARAGIYPESINADVSPERLKQNFIKQDDGSYVINRYIREMLVFAPQDVNKDPPFTKLDVLSCRNLLIYLSAELQKKLLPLFHYSLKPDGLLFLGSSETVGQSPDLFFTLDSKCKVFRSLPSGSYRYSNLDFPGRSVALEEIEPTVSSTIKQAEEVSALQLVETILDQSNMPACAIIDEGANIIFIHGRTGRYLEPAEGKVSVNIQDMARLGLKSKLTAAISEVRTNKREVVLQNLSVEFGNEILFVDLSVKPVLQQSFLRGLMMVVFNEKPIKAGDAAQKLKRKSGKVKSINELEQELHYTKENLQTTIEELETSNEELKSTNEELQSTNEELQSTNEEMETSKEELQSLNEESITVNAELQSRIDELFRTTDDIKNLLDSTNIATLFLDIDLCVRRYTPMMKEIVALNNVDLGRPIEHFSTKLIDVDLDEIGRLVLEDLVVREKQAHSRTGQIFAMKTRPYRTGRNVIDGVVVTFEDVTEREHSSVDQGKLSDLNFRLLFELSFDAAVLVDVQTGSIEDFNEAACTKFGYSSEEFDQLAMSDLEISGKPQDILNNVRSMANQGAFSYESKFKLKNGQIRGMKVKTRVYEVKGERFLMYTLHDTNGGAGR